MTSATRCVTSPGIPSGNSSAKAPPGTAGAPPPGPGSSADLRPPWLPKSLHGPRPVISVGDAGELLAGVFQLVGPLAGPAESAGGLAAQGGGRSTAGELDVPPPVHPPRVGAAGVAWEVPGQPPEDPVHALPPPAVPP